MSYECMNREGDSRMEYRSIKKPATFGSITLADAEKAAKALRPLPKTVSSFERLASTQKGVKVSRFSPRLIRNLRKRLGITKKELAILSGATTGVIHQWESGIFKPKDAKKSAIVALRKLGRANARKILERKK